jgi:hypothetical protein
MRVADFILAKPPLLALLPGNVPAFLQGAGTLSGSKGEAVTFTRATAKTCRKADGSLVTVASGHPAVEPAGVRLEAAHTNLFKRSQGYDDASVWIPQGLSGASAPVVTPAAAIGPFGGMTACRVDFGAATAGQSSDIYQEVAIGSAGTYSQAFWLRGVSGSGTLYYLVYDGSFETAVALNFTTTWQRFIINRNLNATPAVDFCLGFSDAGVWAGLGGHASVYLDQCDLIQNPYALSEVKTTTAAATCNKDQATMAASSLPASSGKLEVDFTPLWASHAGATLLDTRDGSGNNGLACYVVGSDMTFYSAGASTASSVSSSGVTWVAGQTYRIKLVWGAGKLFLYRDDVLIASDTSGSAVMPAAHTTLRLGDGFAGTSPLDGNLSLKAWRGVAGGA